MSDLLSRLTRDDWNCLADVLNGTFMDETMINHDPSFFAAEVEDSFFLEDADLKWFVGAEPREAAEALKSTRPRSMHRRGRRLLELLSRLDASEARILARSIRWFWDHHRGIDKTNDEWWRAAMKAAS